MDAVSPGLTLIQRMKTPNRGLKRYLIPALTQPLLYACIWLTLIAGAAAQSDLTSSASAPKSPFSFQRHTAPVPESPAEYNGITTAGRAEWSALSTIGPTSLAGGLFSAALGTAIDAPSEYGPHWEGFAKRYGMRMTGISTENSLEATLGSVWGEDPRYFHTVHSPFGSRIKNVLDLTFRAYRPDGDRHLAYARYAGIVGNNFLSNTWRAPSEANWQHALIRTGEGFGACALSNAFSEFAPQLLRKIRHKHGTV